MFPPPPNLCFIGITWLWKRKAKSQAGQAKERTRTNHHHYYSQGPTNIHNNAGIALVLPSHPLASMAEILWTLGSKEEKTVISV